MKYNFDLDLVYNNSLSIIAKQIKRDSLVLEFGPANGRLTKYMKENLNCKVFLVEIDEEAGKDALRYAEDLLVGDIEDFHWLEKYSDIKFDYILFADVLEHLYDPAATLKNAKLLLKETGSVLLSVPNIAHNSVVINLLNNKFEYTDIGLLDNTHIRFFTKENLERMIFETGYVPVKCMATYNEVGENEISNSYCDVAGIDSSFWKTRQYGSVYQYIYELKTGREYVEETVENIVEFYPTYFITFECQGNYGYEDRTIQRYKIHGVEDKQLFHVEIPQGTENVKIELINSPCIVADVEVWGIEGEKRRKLEYCSSNLDALEGGLYYFFSEKPELNYSIPEGSEYRKIKLSFKYITLSMREINHMYEAMIRLKKQYTK